VRLAEACTDRTMADRLRELAVEFSAQARAFQQQQEVAPEAPNASRASTYTQQGDS
jgi:hypothetical protein